MRYDNAEHFKEENGYIIEGIWYPRVTRIISIKAKPALENFFKEMENFSSAEDVKNKSAAEGVLVHAAVQKLAVGEKVTVPKEVRPAAEAFQKFNAERKIIFHPEYIERKIWSIRHRYAGTIDAVATVDGKFGVLDIKTSTGFYPEYNLQTAAYVSALQEFQIKKNLLLPRDIETRWILRVNQHKICKKCGATLREKGGRTKIRNGKKLSMINNQLSPCPKDDHNWGRTEGEVELREFPYLYKDARAFIAAKILWEWENDYWLRQAGYLKNGYA